MISSELMHYMHCVRLHVHMKYFDGKCLLMQGQALTAHRMKGENYGTLARRLRRAAKIKHNRK